MSSIYSRDGRLWCRLKGYKVPGKWGSKRTPFVDGQEAEALEYAEEAQKIIDSKGQGGPGALTVRGWAKPWLDERRDLDLDWKNDLGRLNNHILPIIGDMPIADVRTSHILEVINAVRVKKKLAARTVHNVYSVMVAMFRDAKLAGKIAQTPCVLDDRHLGEIIDKDPEWRAGAVFERGEVETIISDERVPEDRRVVYALEFLAGVRYGEAAGLRWRHYDPVVKPLGKLTVARSYNTRKHTEKGTKTNATRSVPLHPTLAAILAAWKLSGWAAMMGRAPEPDDLIVPLPPEVAARRRKRAGEPFRSGDYSWKRWSEDLAMLELRHRRGHDARATFITLAIEDGADEDIIEQRVTHTKKKRGAFRLYDRGLHWERTCAEVAKLRVTRRLATSVLHVAASAGDDSEIVVEAAGVEPDRVPTTSHLRVVTVEVQADLVNAREPSDADRVAKLATDLATAVLGGNRLQAKLLAREILGLPPSSPRGFRGGRG